MTIGVKSAVGVKVGLLVAWLLWGVAMLLLFVPPGVWSGYEEGLQVLGSLLLAGSVVSAIAVAGGAWNRRRNREALSTAWMAAGIVHVILSMVLWGTLLVLASRSS